VSPARARELLDDERERTLARLARLQEEHGGFVEASLNSNADDEHDPEGTTIAFERSQVGALIGQARQRLTEVDAALARVEAATYGICLHCGVTIPDERLEARPTAAYCVSCA
jgi:DnaK suppressor protein